MDTKASVTEELMIRATDLDDRVRSLQGDRWGVQVDGLMDMKG